MQGPDDTVVSLPKKRSGGKKQKNVTGRRLSQGGAASGVPGNERPMGETPHRFLIVCRAPGDAHVGGRDPSARRVDVTTLDQHHLVLS